MAILARILPDCSIAELAYKHYQVLDVTANEAIQAIVTLVEGMPDGTKVVDMIEKQPKLLCTHDLLERIDRVLSKLEKLHPSSDRDVVGGIVEENPELLFRLDYYMDARLLDDLPIEIQNMMVLADQGLGFLYRYYRSKKQEQQGVDLDQELET